MVALTSAVGAQSSPNLAHDVSLIQAMLRVIKTPKGQPYLTFGYDGVFTPNQGTHKAIMAFQQDYKTLTDSPLDKPGVVAKDGRTFQKMVELLPVTHQNLMTIPNLKLVYVAGAAAAAQQSEARVINDSRFQSDFKGKVATLIRQMYQAHKIVLCVIPDKFHGGFRTFEEQRKLLDVVVDGKHVTGAGPGESNHNFGNGADLGFEEFTWLLGSGEPFKDAYWLNQLTKSKPTVAAELWNLRNRLTNLFSSRRPGDLVHMQTFDDVNVSMGKSLADLMSTCGRMYWQYQGGIYKSNFGLADENQFFRVGSAKNIWDRAMNVSEDNLAKALNQATKRRAARGNRLPSYEEEIYQDVLNTVPKLKPNCKASDIKKAHCDVMRRYFREDFEFAEASYRQWQPHL